MENRTELEAKYATSQLKYSLEERLFICAQYDMDMTHVTLQMGRYVDEVKYTIEHGLSLSIVSHLTYNLILVLAKTHKLQADYLYVIKEYLLDERYATNANTEDDYEKNKDGIEELINKLESNNSFEIESFVKDNSWSRKDFIDEFTTTKTSLLSLEKKLAYFNGPELLCCLRHLMDKVYEMIVQAKNAATYVEPHIFEEIYDRNYLLYAQKYWPNDGKGFRSHVEHSELLNNVTEEALRQVYRDIVKDFKTNDVGRIWEDYSEDKQRMGYELKRIAINEDQWKYFFKIVFRLEEIEQWIKELRSSQGTPKEEPAFVELKFFSAKKFNSMERQAALRKLLKESVQKINVDAGRDWVAFYIAYHYYSDTRALTKKFADFFADIEALLPNVLTKVKKDGQGDKRYKNYTESLSLECVKWFVDNSCLPPMNEWTSKKYLYGVNDERKKKMQGIANEVYKGLGEIQ